MTVKQILGDALYQQVADNLKKAFPDKKTLVDDKHVDAYALLAWKNFSDADCMKILGAAKPDQTIIDALFKSLYVPANPDGRSYYVAHAKHTRVSGPTHSFTGHLPVVRVPLALTDKDTTVINTAIGDVDPRDHLLQSVEQVAFKYSPLLGYDPQRVDVVTPARSGGARFGAIAIYLGYRNASDTTPSFYILESGTATGQSNINFISPDMKPIPPRKKWYNPTPFTNENAHYAGDLVMNGDEPGELHVNAMSDTMQPEVNVNVVYEKTPPVYIWPALLTAQAAARVGAISVKMGRYNFEDLFAPIGFALDWDDPLK